MNWLNKLERKFGRYAVPNLIVYLIGAYSVGFVLNMVAPNILGFLNFQPYYILHGQIWSARGELSALMPISSAESC